MKMHHWYQAIKKKYLNSHIDDELRTKEIKFLMEVNRIDINILLTAPRTIVVSEHPYKVFFLPIDIFV